MLIALAAVATGSVVLVAGPEAYWSCVPVCLAVCAATRRRRDAAIGASGVVAAAAGPCLLGSSADRLGSPVLAVLVPVASAFVLVAVRERLERDHATLREVALTDPLTGVANRRSLLARADYEIVRHARSRRSFALVMLDLDGFKLLNDRFGHAAGDELLREVALALRDAVRAQDTVARFGGDEFCVLAPETDGSGAQRLVDRIAAAVGGVTAGVDALGASVGVAVFPAEGEHVPELLELADRRMLAVKRADRRTHRRAA